MNKVNSYYQEQIKKAREQMETEILIYHKLEEFKKTRAIATAVEICDMFIKEMGTDE